MNRNSRVFRIIKKIENPPNKWLWRRLNTLFCWFCVWRGRRFYHQLKKKHQGKTLILIPTRSAGDLFFLKMMFDEMLRACGISDYVIILNESLKRVATVLLYENTEYHSMGEVGTLNMYYHFACNEIPDMIDCYSWSLFELRRAKKGLSLTYPKFDTDREKIAAYFEKGEDSLKKAVILAPYAQTIVVEKRTEPPVAFWERLAATLQERGYEVYTNCSNSAAEPVVAGTKQIFPLLSEIEDISSFAGNYIALRSGFVDYSCRADAVKTVLYPDADYFEQWSTNSMGISRDVREFIFDDLATLTSYDDLLERVLEAYEGVTSC